MSTPFNIDPKKDAQARTHALFRLISELAFVLLPLVIVVFVWGGRGNLMKALMSPEWSFGTCVLFGQTTVKLVLGCVIDRQRINKSLMAVVVTLLVVGGIVPSSVILAQLIDVENPNSFLVGAQWVWFAISFISYLWLGGLGEYKIALREAWLPIEQG